MANPLLFQPLSLKKVQKPMDHTDIEKGNVKDMENAQVLIVSVTDVGKGIDREILPRLFTKFTTNSDQGTGLGLYIAKNIIEAHGGQLWAQNNADGKGATFSFSLPLDH